LAALPTRRSAEVSIAMDRFYVCGEGEVGRSFAFYVGRTVVIKHLKFWEEDKVQGFTVGHYG